MKNSQKILIVILIVIIAIGGYFTLKTKQQPIAQQILVTSVDDTVNWKTYINTKYGYEFKYPENVGIINEESSDYAGPPSNPEEDMLLLADKEKTFYIEIDKNVVNVIKKSTLSDQILSTFKFTK